MTTREVRVCGEGADLPKIFIFVNGIAFGSDLDMCALAEDGEDIAGHCSSNESFGYHDMGMSSDWKHDKYRAKYPNGFQLVWLGKEPAGDQGWQAALEKAKARYAPPVSEQTHA